MTHRQSDSPWPDPPSFTEQEIRECKESGDYRPILFEWYKFVGVLSTVTAHIQRHSPAYKPVPSEHYYILVGLLNRCARLMLSNIALSHEGKFGETTAIVDRCIFETAIKIIWLCSDSSQEKFTRFLADGLKTELDFKQQIYSKIAARNGDVLPIESRMLHSIANHIDASGLTEGQIEETKKLPDLASMLMTIGLDRLIYVTAQRIGSHHIHGTWPSLLSHYLEEVPSGSREFVPRGHDCSTHSNQYLFVPKVVLHAMSSYVQYAFEDLPETQAFEGLFQSTRDEITRIYTESVGGDLGS